MNRQARGALRLCGTMLSLAALASGYALPGYSLSEAAAARDGGARTRLQSRTGTRDGGRVNQRRTVPSTQDGGLKQDHEEAPPGRIAFASDRDENFEIYLVDPDGGGLTRLTNNPAEDVHPAWSPDGTRLAFVSNRDGNQEIYTINADGTGQTRLTNNPAADLEPAWSPDGARIVFVSNRDGNDEIYVMNADGTAQANLTNDGGDDNSPAWSPNGAGIAFSSNRDGDKHELYRMNADGTDVKRLTNNAANDLHPTWAAGRITFQSDRDGNDEIYSMNEADGSNVFRLTTSTDDPATPGVNEAFTLDLDPSRAPDGSRVAFVSNRDGATNLDIYLANADGGGVTRLTSHPNSDIDPAVQPRAQAQGAVRFSAATYTAGEGDGSVAVTVTRTGVTTGGLVVDLFTNSGTASERTDFTATFRTLEFAPGETSKVVSIPIVNDAFIESDETFSVTLARANGANLGSPSTAVVTISDNDAPPSPTTPVTLYGVTPSTTSNNFLISFSSATPGTISSMVEISGLAPGEDVMAIDVRPATRQLYGLVRRSFSEPSPALRLVIINPTTGATTPVGTFFTVTSGFSFGFDFNPTVDRIRITTDTDINLRVHPDTGAVVATDGPLAYAAGDTNAGQNPNVSAAAYTNNFAGATTTTLYGIDEARDVLVTQNPPNNGTLNTVGPLGINAASSTSFDIAPGSGTAFASFGTTFVPEASLYTINLTTGAATSLGLIGRGTPVRALAVANPFPNPIDDAAFFVRQQYLDFLNREPDAGGLAFWTNDLVRLIANCNAVADPEARRQCVLGAKAQISTAFFLSIEFQGTGLFVIQVYLEAFGRLPTFREFLEDLGAIREGVVIGQPGAFELLAANRAEYLDRFTRREDFRARYDAVSNTAFVNALFTNAGVDPASEAAARDALVAGLNNGTETRESVLLKVSQTRSVYNATFNRSFVLMEYFGYLRRDPDPEGFQFWLDKLNSVSLPDEDVRDPGVALARIKRAQMVEAFIDSIEYRGRFGPT